MAAEGQPCLCDAAVRLRLDPHTLGVGPGRAAGMNRRKRCSREEENSAAEPVISIVTGNSHTGASCSRSRVPAAIVPVLVAGVIKRVGVADESAHARCQMHLGGFHRRRQVGPGQGSRQPLD